MNSIVIIGRLTEEPKYAVRDVDGKKLSVCNFTVAVNSRNTAGRERTDYFKVGVWRGPADACAKYLHQKNKVAVRGSIGLEQREYKGRVYTDLVIHNAQVEFLDKLPSAADSDPHVETTVDDEENSTNETNDETNEMETVSAEEIDDDDLPF